MTVQSSEWLVHKYSIYTVGNQFTQANSTIYIIYIMTFTYIIPTFLQVHIPEPYMRAFHLIAPLNIYTSACNIIAMKQYSSLELDT